MVDVIGAPRCVSSIDRRIPLFDPFVHGISTKRMECGSFFWELLAVDGGVVAVRSSGCIWRR